jgi:hypothetical protein
MSPLIQVQIVIDLLVTKRGPAGGEEGSMFLQEFVLRCQNLQDGSLNSLSRGFAAL